MNVLNIKGSTQEPRLPPSHQLLTLPTAETHARLILLLFWCLVRGFRV